MEPVIATLPYYKVEREVDKLSIDTVVYEHEMQLCASSLRTAHKEIPIAHLYDISYRRMCGQDGMLYLHTNQGIVSFTVQVDPCDFIEAFQKLAGK
ncbi:hypothetical protein [Paenibacillus sp. 1P07SE]|uniref:hypothetical protein n=1 Tax=Paenibacillus sp. 1P07SE TaxID=3132209 RepID=UPI0039A5C189